MDRKYVLSCESTVDLPYDTVRARGISVLFYTYTVGDTEQVDNMGRDKERQREFYQSLARGALPKTSQINQMRYYEYFLALSETADVLHITLGTGMTASYGNALLAAAQIESEYPERRVRVIDSLCSSTGYGLLTEAAADLYDEGMPFSALENWLIDNRLRVRHQFFSTDLTMFKRSGRVSGPVALVGSMLGVTPIMHLDAEGRIVAYTKVIGRKKAIAKTVATVLDEIDGGGAAEGRIYIAHSNSPELAEETRVAFCAALGNGGRNIKVVEIGTIIASHCGAGTVAVFYFGTPRT